MLINSVNFKKKIINKNIFKKIKISIDKMENNRYNNLRA